MLQEAGIPHFCRSSGVIAMTCSCLSPVDRYAQLFAGKLARALLAKIACHLPKALTHAVRRLSGIRRSPSVLLSHRCRMGVGTFSARVLRSSKLRHFREVIFQFLNTFS